MAKIKNPGSVQGKILQNLYPSDVHSNTINPFTAYLTIDYPLIAY
jgi:hypothetical protein